MTVTSMKQFKANQEMADADKKAMDTIVHFEGMHRFHPHLFTYAAMELYKGQQELTDKERKTVAPKYHIQKGEPLWAWLEDLSFPQEQFGTPIQATTVSVIGCKIVNGVEDPMRKRNLVIDFLKQKIDSPSVKVAQRILKQLDAFCTVSADEEMGVITFVAKAKEWDDYIVLAINLGLLEFIGELDELMKPYRGDF